MIQMEMALARRTDPGTSHVAAARVDVPKAERQVLNALATLGGKGINNEIAEVLDLRVNATSPRMKPLEKKGLVRRTEYRRDRQIVWELT